LKIIKKTCKIELLTQKQTIRTKKMSFFISYLSSKFPCCCTTTVVPMPPANSSIAESLQLAHSDESHITRRIDAVSQSLQAVPGNVSESPQSRIHDPSLAQLQVSSSYSPSSCKNQITYSPERPNMVDSRIRGSISQQRFKLPPAITSEKEREEQEMLGAVIHNIGRNYGHAIRVETNDSASQIYQTTMYSNGLRVIRYVDYKNCCFVPDPNEEEKHV
jgi:hypothetical protein